MKKRVLLLTLLLIPGGWLAAEEIAITVHSLKSGNIGDSVGVIVARETGAGLVLEPHLDRLGRGSYEVNVHEYATCHGRYNEDGSIEPGASAGSPIVNLPMLELREGQRPATLVSKNLRLQDIKNRSIMLSRLDETAPMDAISSKVACGALEN
ncbi:MAG: hypothetical protein SV201_02970 [Pseudomonadota bacterium]|nr:hypothetical protein [Pseudomonadota bacterium]